MNLSQALADVAAERLRQQQEEGWTPEHDDQHRHGELARAAASYAVSNRETDASDRSTVPTLWPWSYEWWKPKGRRRNLVRAAALLIAEIERLDRAAAGKPEVA